MKNTPFLVALALILFLSCKKEAEQEETSRSFPLSPGIVDEASGIADSKLNSGAIWVEQDGGNPAEITLLSHAAQLIKKIAIKGVQNRDWEDISISPGPDKSQNYMYIGEIGDNAGVFDSYSIIRFPEPASSADTIFQADIISFKYPDGHHDAEAFLVDPDNLDIYIITKRDTRSLIYKLNYPYSISSMNTATAVGELSYNMVVSAAIQPDGKGIVVKDYSTIYYYPRNAGETIFTTLTKSFLRLNYIAEPQGEAFCFANDGAHYFTLSERVNANVFLRYYSK